MEPTLPSLTSCEQAGIGIGSLVRHDLILLDADLEKPPDEPPATETDSLYDLCSGCSAAGAAMILPEECVADKESAKGWKGVSGTRGEHGSAASEARLSWCIDDCISRLLLGDVAIASYGDVTLVNYEVKDSLEAQGP